MMEWKNKIKTIKWNGTSTNIFTENLFFKCLPYYIFDVS